MASYDAFRAQLASIMAAVAEMCELLDDNYGALRLELSRCHRENEALRGKLRLMESTVSRERGAACRGDVLVYSGRDEDRRPELVPSPGHGVRVRKVSRTASVSPPQPSPGAAESIHLRLDVSSSAGGGCAEVVLIKQEETEEDGSTAPDSLLLCKTEDASAAGPSGLHSDCGEPHPVGGAVKTDTATVLNTTNDTALHSSRTNHSSPHSSRTNHSPPSPEPGPPRLNAFPFIGLSASQLELRGVGSERRFGCTYCGKYFSSARGLETHIRVHTGERPFCCAHCGKRFTQSGHLKTHQSVHTGERPFVCHSCGKRFAGKQNLRIHQQKHHPGEAQAL